MNEASTTPRVHLIPSGKQFDAPPGRSLLDAGLGAGLPLPYGCANGSCGKCRARLCSGSILKLKHHDFTLSEAEKLDGICLLCSNTPTSDCKIEVIEATSPSLIPEQELTARVSRLEQSGSAMIVNFKISRGKALHFLPGQLVKLIYADGFSVTLPVASCPCIAHTLEFHLTEDQLGTSFEKLILKLTQTSPRERIRINGPFGEFTLGEAISAPKLFLVSGGEFSQLQGMIEQVFNLDLGIPCCLVWQVSEHVDHYRHNLCRAWRDAIDEFDYLPLGGDDDILSNLSSAWTELLPSAEVYLGHQNESLAQSLFDQGLPHERLHYPGCPGC